VEGRRRVLAEGWAGREGGGGGTKAVGVEGHTESLGCAKPQKLRSAHRTGQDSVDRPTGVHSQSRMRAGDPQGTPSRARAGGSRWRATAASRKGTQKGNDGQGKARHGTARQGTARDGTGSDWMKKRRDGEGRGGGGMGIEGMATPGGTGRLTGRRCRQSAVPALRHKAAGTPAQRDGENTPERLTRSYSVNRAAFNPTRSCAVQRGATGALGPRHDAASRCRGGAARALWRCQWLTAL
jgi:hypothetical protein